MNLRVYSGMTKWETNVHGRCCMHSRGSRGIFYLVYQIGECAMGRHQKLLEAITPLLRSMCGSGVLWGSAAVGYLVLLVFAALICVA